MDKSMGDKLLVIEDKTAGDEENSRWNKRMIWENLHLPPPSPPPPYCEEDCLQAGIYINPVRRSGATCQEHLHSVPRHPRIITWSHAAHRLRWNSLTAFLVEVSGHKIKSSQTRVSVWFSTLIFLFYKMLFINRLEFSYFEDWFKTRKEYGFR